jgi:hypothetical protein
VLMEAKESWPYSVLSFDDANCVAQVRNNFDGAMCIVQHTLGLCISVTLREGFVSRDGV